MYFLSIFHFIYKQANIHVNHNYFFGSVTYSDRAINISDHSLHVVSHIEGSEQANAVLGFLRGHVDVRVYAAGFTQLHISHSHTGTNTSSPYWRTLHKFPCPRSFYPHWQSSNTAAEPFTKLIWSLYISVHINKLFFIYKNIYIYFFYAYVTSTFRPWQ